MAKYLKLYSDGCNGTISGGLYEIPDKSVLKNWYERTRGVFETDDRETLLVRVPDEVKPWPEEEEEEEEDEDDLWSYVR